MSTWPELDRRSADAEHAAPVDVSAIIVTYRSRRFIGSCLDALALATGGVSYEVLVIDNDSRDGTVDYLRATYPHVRIVEVGRNAGFASACNIGLVASTGRNVMLLNPDTAPQAGSIARMVALLDGDATVGATGPLLLNPDLTDQGTARAFPTPAAALLGRRSPLTRLWPNNPWSEKYLVGSRQPHEMPFEIDWMSGACLMVRRDVLERVGPLDGHFFMYWEDADWCRRIKADGLRVVCEPRAVVIHDEGVARGRAARQSIWFHRSAYRYFDKHHLESRGRSVHALAAAALTVRAASAMFVNAVNDRRSR
jgi:N-acetylglucosaminyl-diphospho-decaprenol L-rhamnosyltransferase